MPIIDINSDAVVVYAAKLERMRRSALPVAIRQTLNGTVLDVKRDTMITESDRAFNKRKPSFFPATSRAEFAKGLNINSMAATVGFVAPATAKESGHATRDLEEQEHGGDIDKRAFIATDQARSPKGNVKNSLTMAEIKKAIVNANNSKNGGRTDEERFVRASIYAGVGGYVLGSKTYKNGNKHLLKILSIIRVGGNTHISTELIYNVKGGRKAHVGATNFMKKASATSASKMNALFIEMANIQLNKMK